MALSTPKIQTCAAELAVLGVTLGTQQVRAAAQALDDYLEANQAAINAALPEPFKSAATIEQKAALLMLVTRKRYL